MTDAFDENSAEKGEGGSRRAALGSLSTVGAEGNLSAAHETFLEPDRPRMQVKNSQGKFEFPSIEGMIRPTRLGRYMVGPGYNREVAVNVYIWNCELSEAFQFPLHIAEIVTRNAIQNGLRVRFKNPWYEQKEFVQLLDAKNRDHLTSVLFDEREQHGERMTDDHVVSSLHFGFWDHLTTKRFDRTLWLRGIRHNFPKAYSDGKTVRDINELIQRVRRWRNRIAHYRAIFDKEPNRKYEEALTLIEWVCPNTAMWVRGLSAVPDALARSPISNAADAPENAALIADPVKA